ncbi:sodium:proton antiporter [Enterococcus sp. BWT-B8]|uniref:cation:proton antiporter n=1 Tax=unclassified Enterococcus TaxID=2608891 RepID=UPI001E4073F8|nr:MULTISPECIES: sodium:proton antiporter [unclassified Enterococcus]MCB5953221.1 sodium:proton antiporter [Enterococcus sp. BWT-B8]MCB5956231.1 sodium:proton antiporter [Enterococcus sp. CWB-B31]
MEFVTLIIMFAFAVTFSNIISRVLPIIPTPFIQIFVGILIGLTEQGRSITFEPELFLIMIIAPLLFREGEKMNVRTFLKNSGPILFLAFGGVVLTLLAVGGVFYILLPTIPLAACFALGAALGPTDAVAVKSLAGNLKFSEKSTSILEGEGLLNDASGVTAFQFALGALITGSFSLLEASETLLFSSLFGALIGFLLVWMKNKVVELIERASAKDVTGYLLLELLLPFLAYLLAEEFHASGIIAAVVAGVMQSSGFRKVSLFEAKLSNVSDTTWSTIEFTLNALVFLFLGIEVSQVFSPIWNSVTYSNPYLLLIVVIISILLFLVRFIYIVAFYLYKEGYSTVKSHFHDLLVLTFGGVKGTVSLATIFILPLSINGETFEDRSLLLFITACVILTTLLVGMVVLPILAEDEEVETADGSFIAILEEVKSTLMSEVEGKSEDNRLRLAAEVVIENYQDRIGESYTNTLTSDERSESQELQALMLSVERDSLDNYYRQGKITINGYRFYSRFIDNFDKSITRQILSFASFWLAFVKRLLRVLLHPKLFMSRHQKGATLLSQTDIAEVKALFLKNSELLLESLENLQDVYDESLIDFYAAKRKRLLIRLEQGTLIPSMLIQQEAEYAREMLRGYYLERKIIDEYEVSNKITSWTANDYRQRVNLLESYSINNLTEQLPLTFVLRKRRQIKNEVKERM